jgi:hypothetical protein
VFCAFFEKIDSIFLSNSHVINDSLSKIIISGEQVLEFVSEAQKSGGKISPYLKTKTLDATPVFEEQFLRIYGSNFYELVEKDGGFTTPDRPKALLLLFLWPNCVRCQHIEAYLESYAFQPKNSNRLKHFQFATFDLATNTPSPWYVK